MKGTPDYKLKFSDRLIQVMKEKGYVNIRSKVGIDVAALSDVIGVTYGLAYRYLTNKAFPRQDNLEKISKWLSVSPSWLEYGIKFSSVPVLKWDGSLFRTNKTWQNAIKLTQEWVPLHLPENLNYFALKLEDNTWSPMFPRGTRIVFDHSQPPQGGELALVLEPDSGLLFGILKKQFDRYYLRGADEKLPMQELSSQVMLVGKFVAADFTG